MASQPAFDRPPNTNENTARIEDSKGSQPAHGNASGSQRNGFMADGPLREAEDVVSGQQLKRGPAFNRISKLDTLRRSLSLDLEKYEQKPVSPRPEPEEASPPPSPDIRCGVKLT